MTTETPQTTAKIYQFPVGGRAVFNRRNETTKPTEQNPPQIAVGSGWYHDAAIEESHRGQEH
jgi:hypothetical protein